MTLVELLVTLAVLGIAAAVVTVALPRPAAHSPHTPAARIAAARREALERGRPVTIVVHVDTALLDVTVNPDGSVLADAPLHFDRFAGRSTNVAP
jgi:prepilin-type N-terminal cleavage/methylation domain-containing protein